MFGFFVSNKCHLSKSYKSSKDLFSSLNKPTILMSSNPEKFNLNHLSFFLFLLVKIVLLVYEIKDLETY